MRNGLFHASSLPISDEVRATLTDPHQAAEAAALLPEHVRAALALFCSRRPVLLDTAITLAAGGEAGRCEGDDRASSRRNGHRAAEDLTLCMA